MNAYEWILFDADETLFHFDSFRGLQLMFSRFDIEFVEKDYQEYQAINQPLWADYQNSVIDAGQLKNLRFKNWSDRLQVSTKDLNSAFLCAMVEIGTPLEGAERLLRALKNVVSLGIITNGFTELQKLRLQRTGFESYFKVLVVSEEVGVAKPHRKIFDHALSLMGNPSREKVLMVGDNPHSDIRGGIDAGLDTCWLNTRDHVAPEGIVPKYEVSSLLDLEKMLLKIHPKKKM